MKNFILLLLFVACSHQSPIKPLSQPKLPMTLEINPGTTTLVTLPSWFRSGEDQLICDKEVVPTFEKDRDVHAFVRISYKEQRKEIKCVARDDQLLVTLNIVPYAYQVERIQVDKKHVDLSARDLKRWQGEVARLKKVYSTSAPYPLFNGPFVRPLDSIITSPYGKLRLFNNKKESLHTGVDFRAPTGTPIPNTNRGKVVFADDLFFNGMTVIVDHGLGIFSMSCHLSKILVQEGEVIDQGDLIGLAGSTGRSSGPHLHWAIKMYGDWINGLTLADQEF
jgi:murein DD-endopeptidase MepM/ murein hydrolase activator NlpD